jgi:hypothetical protein
VAILAALLFDPQQHASESMSPTLRTHMPGGVGGAMPRGVPLSRSMAHRVISLRRGNWSLSADIVEKVVARKIWVELSNNDSKPETILNKYY